MDIHPPTKGKDILVVNCYRPPQGHISECLRYLEAGLLELGLNKTDIFIIGELNMNMLDTKKKLYKLLITLSS